MRPGIPALKLWMMWARTSCRQCRLDPFVSYTLSCLPNLINESRQSSVMGAGIWHLEFDHMPSPEQLIAVVVSQGRAARECPGTMGLPWDCGSHTCLESL